MAEPTEADTKRARGAANAIVQEAERIFSQPQVALAFGWSALRDYAQAEIMRLLAEVREESRELAEDNRDGDWCEAFGAVRGPVTQSRRREMVDEARREGREEVLADMLGAEPLDEPGEGR